MRHATVRFQVMLGVALGLALAGGVLYFRQVPRPVATRGSLLSECDGSLRRLVIQYGDSDDDIVMPAYRSFLPQLPADVEVYVVCPNREVFDTLVERVGPTAATLTPVLVDHPITSWSRDRWLALAAADGNDTTLLCSKKEDGAAIWPARDGDQQVALDLAAALGPTIHARRSDLNFDAGDFAADGDTVFVRPSVLLRNVERTVSSRAELTEALADTLGRRLVWLDGAPDHHVGMYLMPVGNRTVLVGDPRLAEMVLSESPAEKEAAAAFLPGGPDFSAAAVAAFDTVAQECRDAGYRVVRIPVAPGTDSRTYLTFVNGIQDQREGRHIIYMPVYSFAPNLNRAAAAVWSNLGFEVKEVDCDSAARNFGTLHCLVNVLQRQ